MGRYNNGDALSREYRHCFYLSDAVSLFFLRGRRPLLRNASAMIYCSCPLVERNSSAAHRSIASIISASMRSTKFLVLSLAIVSMV